MLKVSTLQTTQLKRSELIQFLLVDQLNLSDWETLGITNIVHNQCSILLEYLQLNMLEM